MSIGQAQAAAPADGAGLGALVARVRAGVRNRVAAAHRYEVYVRSTHAPVPHPKTAIPLEVHHLTGVGDPVVDALPPEPKSAARRHMRRGVQGWVALDGGTAAAWVWLGLRPWRESWTGVHSWLRRDEGMLFGLFSEPAYRSSGAGAHLMAAALEDIARTHPDLRWLYGFTDLENRQALLLFHLVLGFKKVQEVSSVEFLNRFGWQVPFTSSPYGAGPASVLRRSAAPPVAAAGG